MNTNPKLSTLTRRDFLRLSLIAGGSAVLVPILNGCGDTIPVDIDIPLPATEMPTFTNPTASLPSPSRSRSGIPITSSNVNQMERLSTLRGDHGVINALAISKDGSLVATAAMDSTVTLWDTETGKGLYAFRIREVCFHALAFSPDGRLLASSEAIWDVESGQMLHALEQANHPVAFSADGSILAVPYLDQLIKFWDISSGLVVRTFENQAFTIPHDIAFSPDGKFLAVGGHKDDGTDSYGIVTLQNLEEGHELQILDRDRTNSIHGIAFSQDSQFLASAGTEGMTKIWEVASGEVVGGWQGNGCYDVNFSLDGSLVVTSGCDLAARLWDAKSGRSLRSLNHGCEVVSVEFSRDGTLLASAGYDGNVNLWGIPQ